MRFTLAAVALLLPLLAFSAPIDEHHGICDHHTYDICVAALVPLGALNCLKVRDGMGCLIAQGVDLPLKCTECLLSG